ncbi:MAG: CvpA family protein [Sphaerochaetaceae bacterium]|nr:CvpA family protein [Sphaerochaetaceae bacterium]MDC7237029.1 CvpA family protein [Sphaerochaetaceae bacterium]MDC7242490.1 CvpA family protein [Sphaerochaetaceae bacterium]MDC7249682.1 CvpA family protein [Sphaerochaetaceae bacterium]
MDFTINIGSAVLNILDIIILAIALIGGVAGAFEGFAKSFASKAAVLVGLIVGLMFSELAMANIFSRFNLPIILLSLFSYMFCFIIGYVVMLLLGNMLSTVFEGVGLSPLNSLLGFIWAIVFILALCAVALMLLSYQHLFDITDLINESFMFQNIFEPIIPVAEDFIKNVQ